MSDTQGIVYALSNRSLWLPEREYDDELLPIVKIGRTSPATPNALKKRMGQLFTTGIALPFDLEYAKAVDDCYQVESALHRIFASARVNPTREFFRVDVDSVVAALAPYQGKEIKIEGGEVSDEITQEDLDARNKLESVAVRRGYFSFSAVGIPIGATLTSTMDSSRTATVVSDSQIDFEGEIMNIGAAATKLRYELTGKSEAVSGSAKWNYNGKRLRLIKESIKNG